MVEPLNQESGGILCLSKAFWEAKEIGKPQTLVKRPSCVSKQLQAHRFTVPPACNAWNASFIKDRSIELLYTSLPNWEHKNQDKHKKTSFTAQQLNPDTCGYSRYVVFTWRSCKCQCSLRAICRDVGLDSYCALAERNSSSPEGCSNALTVYDGELIQ